MKTSRALNAGETVRPGFTVKRNVVNGQIFDLDLNNDIKHYNGLKPLHDAEAQAANSRLK